MQRFHHPRGAPRHPPRNGRATVGDEHPRLGLNVDQSFALEEAIGGKDESLVDAQFRAELASAWKPSAGDEETEVEPGDDMPPNRLRYYGMSSPLGNGDRPAQCQSAVVRNAAKRATIDARSPSASVAILIVRCSGMHGTNVPNARERPVISCVYSIKIELTLEITVE
jgi:hypothetical protein